jgi:Flp pilus assembly pilin Flp
MAVILKHLAVGEEGATMVEYGLMVALIGAALVRVVASLSSSISWRFTTVANTLALP